MRTLIPFFISNFFFVIISAHAVSYELRSSVGVQDNRAPLQIFGIQNSVNTKNLRSSLAFRSEDFVQGFSHSFQLDINRPDYQNLTIRNQNQEPVSTNNPNSEIFADTGLQYRKNNALFGAHVFSHLNRSLFPQKGFSLQTEWDFFDQTSILGAEATALTQKRPLDYFVDRDFHIKARPTKIHAQEFAIFAEQILNEYWKSRMRLLTNQKKEERPRVIGVEATQAIAIPSLFYTRLYTNFYQELRSQALKNERGYFSAYQAKLELTREWFYNFNTSVSYGITVERESDPRVPSKIQIGADHYGVGIEYGMKEITLEAQGSWYQTNAGSSGAEWSGVFVWTI